jgi:hypothetical protein
VMYDPRARGKDVNGSAVSRVVTRREPTRDKHGRRGIFASVASAAGHAVQRRRRTRAGGGAPHHAAELDERVHPQYILAPAVDEENEAGAEADCRREGRIRVVGLEPVPPLRRAAQERTYRCHSAVSALDASS